MNPSDASPGATPSPAESEAERSEDASPPGGADGSGADAPREQADETERDDGRSAWVVRAVAALRAWRKPLGYALGLLLLVAAVFAVAQAGDPLDTLAPLAHADPLAVLGVVALTVAIGFFVSLGFWAATTRYGRVGVGEMFALIVAAWLLNYLPAWPGMFGRLAYHKAVNKIAVRDAVKGVVWANVVNTANAALMAALVLAVPLFVSRDQTLIGLVTLAPMVAMFVGAEALRRSPADRERQHWRLLLCGGFRWIEMLGWAARFWLIFLIIDRPIAWSCALTLACLPTLVRAVPISPNGVGVRTWAVGLTIVMLHSLGLPTEADPAESAHDLAWNVGLTADLVLLAVEVVVALPLGLGASAWLAKRRKRGGADRRSAHADADADARS